MTAPGSFEANGSTTGSAAVFLFLHVMKTGGSSFLGHLADNFDTGQLEPDARLKASDDPRFSPHPYGSVQRLTALSDDRRREVCVYAGHYPYMVTELVRPDITMTVLRDPVERTISFLRHCKRYDAGKRHLPLEQIYDDEWMFPLLIHNYQSKLFCMTPADEPPDKAHLCPIEMDEARLRVAERNLATLDVIGFHDRYGDFLAELGHRFGWRFPNTYRRRVATEGWEPTAALRARIAADNEADIAFYRAALALQRADAPKEI